MNDPSSPVTIPLPDCRPPLAARIHARRVEMGLSMTTFARLLGVSRNTAYNVEAGERTLRADLIPALCRALWWTPNELFNWEEE